MVPCEHLSSEHKWTYVNSQIQYERTKECLTVGSENGKDTLTLQNCDASSLKQKWKFDKQKEGTT